VWLAILIAGGSSTAADAQVPQLKSLSFSTQLINVGSTGPAYTDLHIIARVAEPTAGFNYGILSLTPTVGFGKSVQFDATNRISGDAFDGTYESIIRIYQFTQTGEYDAAVYLYGNAGSTMVTTAQLQSMGYPWYVNLVGTTDTAPPQLVGINFGPVPVNTIIGYQTATVTLHITDTDTGFRSGDFLFVAPPCAREPDGESKGAHVDATNRISGDAKDGIYQIQVTFPQFEVDGPWSIDFYMQDGVGNNQIVLSPQIAGIGPNYIQVIGSACVQNNTTLQINAVCSDGNPAHGLADITFNVTFPDGHTEMVTTDHMGMYGLMGPIGTYTITAPTSGNGLLLADTATQTVTVPAGGGAITFHYTGATISGKLYYDVNNDLAFTAGQDVLLPGVLVQLYDSTGTIPITDDNGNLVKATTDANGHYAFGGICLEAGSYMVCVPNTVNNAQTGGKTATAVANCLSVTVAEGDDAPNVDFKYQVPPGGISGIAYCDDNHNGVPDAGEGASVTVQVKNSMGQVVASVVTLGQPSPNAGKYSFTGLPAGTYTVVVSGTVLPDGCTLNSANPLTVTVTSGGTSQNNNFKYLPSGGGATRTWGFYKTHLVLFTKVVAYGAINLGDLKVTTAQSSTVTHQDLTNCIGKLSTLEAIFQTSPGSSQTALGQARLQLAHQLMAAEANVYYVGTTSPALVATLNAARAALDGTDTALILNYNGQLDTFNNSGDAKALPAPLTEGKADPKGAAASAASGPGTGPAFK